MLLSVALISLTLFKLPLFHTDPKPVGASVDPIYTEVRTLIKRALMNLRSDEKIVSECILLNVCLINHSDHPVLTVCLSCIVFGSVSVHMSRMCWPMSADLRLPDRE